MAGADLRRGPKKCPRRRAYVTRRLRRVPWDAVATCVATAPSFGSTGKLLLKRSTQIPPVSADKCSNPGGRAVAKDPAIPRHIRQSQSLVCCEFSILAEALKCQFSFASGCERIRRPPCEIQEPDAGTIVESVRASRVPWRAPHRRETLARESR